MISVSHLKFSNLNFLSVSLTYNYVEDILLQQVSKTKNSQ